MSKDLTIAQFAQIALGKTEKPLHLVDLLGVYKENILPLKSTMAKLSKAQTFMFVIMLSRANSWPALGPNSYGDVQYNISLARSLMAAGKGSYFWQDWGTAWLSGNSNLGAPGIINQYQTLATRLKSVDASIFYLSPPLTFPIINPAVIFPSVPSNIKTVASYPWIVIGIVGTFGGLANLNAQIVPFWPNNWSDQDWTTITNFANSNDDLLLAPAELVPALWRLAQEQTINVPNANMLLLTGS